jgi:hypothetical protein
VAARRSRAPVLAAVGVGLCCALAAGAFFLFSPPPPTETGKGGEPPPTEPVKVVTPTNPETKKEPETLWEQTPGPVITLFNGKDLVGWRTTERGKGNWTVEDGAITCEGKEDYLYTFRNDYGDFHLRAEVKILHRGNSGIFFRTDKPLQRVGDYEAQICNIIGEPQKTGSLYNRNPVNRALVSPGEWFVYEVIAEGKRIRLLVNNEVTTDYTETRPGRRIEGHIALQHLAGKVYFRKLELKELPQDKIPP